MVYRQDNRRNKHKGRYTILGIVLGVILTGAALYLYDHNRQPILDNVNEVKNFAIKQIPKDSPIINNNKSPVLILHELVNTVREEKGLPPLTWNDKISQIAQIHSNEMLTSDNFSHEGLSDRLSQMGCPNGSENIEVTNGYYIEQVPQVAIDDWLNSYGHRANVLSPVFTSEGIGISQDGDKTMISEDFC